MPHADYAACLIFLRHDFATVFAAAFADAATLFFAAIDALRSFLMMMRCHAAMHFAYLFIFLLFAILLISAMLPLYLFSPYAAVRRLPMLMPLRFSFA